MKQTKCLNKKYVKIPGSNSFKYFVIAETDREVFVDLSGPREELNKHFWIICLLSVALFRVVFNVNVLR